MTIERHASPRPEIDPAAVVGHFARRRDQRTRQGYTPWAEVAMIVPSADGPCWLVVFNDGDVDVWRPTDAGAGYQFRPAPAGVRR